MITAYSSNSRYNQRLQISLSTDLRFKAEKLAKQHKMSLSELFRFLVFSAPSNYVRIKEENTDFSQAIDSVVGIISKTSHPEWKNKKSINQWLNNSRKLSDRQFS